jgi:hypothetical protein
MRGGACCVFYAWDSGRDERECVFGRSGLRSAALYILGLSVNTYFYYR